MKTILSLLIIILGIIFESNAQWIQVGQNINGETDNESGSSISLNSEGSIIAIGSPNLGDVNNTSHVKVYQNISGEWFQLGNTIIGKLVRSVKLSSDGLTIVIGSPRDNSDDTDVRIFQYISGSWLQIGQTINGENYADGFGGEVSISSDGSIVAVAASHCHNPYTEGGRVYIYEKDMGEWTQIGNSIDGEANYDNTGNSISLNSNGLIIGVGSPGSNYLDYDCGQVKIFENVSNSWVQKGNSINGELKGDKLGSKVTINSEGNIIAIGTLFNYLSENEINYIKVYKYMANEWIQIGDKIEIESVYSYSIDINSDGSVIVIGEDEISYNGQVKVFHNISDNWVLLNSIILGEEWEEEFGYNTSINSEGNIIAAGAPRNGNNGYNSGLVRVFENISLDINPKNVIDNSYISPNPTTGILNIKIMDLNTVHLFDLSGNILGKHTCDTDNYILDIGNRPKGFYIIKLITKRGVFVKRICLE